MLNGISATGKTRLYHLLREYRAAKLPVAGYSYSEYMDGLRISQYLNTGLKLIIIDRYDMYNGEMASDIIELSKESIVLIDCKTTLDIIADIEYKDIEMGSDYIHIV